MPEDAAFLNRKELSVQDRLKKLYARRLNDEIKRLLTSAEFFVPLVNDYSGTIAKALSAMCKDGFNQDAALALHGHLHFLATLKAEKNIKYPTEDDL